jgi:hypothetical protein
MPEIRINSFDELLDALFFESWQADIRRFRSPFVFRGQQNAAATLQTSLMKLGGNYADMEPHLIRNFRKYAHRSEVERDSLWDWLSLGQHHGLPTRILDWTVSPLVAAHFATADVERFDQDAAIWMVNQRKAHQLAPQKLNEILRRQKADYFTVSMLAETIPSLDSLDRLAPPLFVLFFEPPSLDERIINQYALFSVMPDATAALDDWLTAQPELYRKVILPAELKWEVRDKLDQANITERVLFPGLDGLSKWQKRYYTPRM